MEKNENFKVNDRVYLIDNKGNKWIGTIININEYREPSKKYCIDLDDYKKDYLFVGIENIEKV